MLQVQWTADDISGVGEIYAVLKNPNWIPEDGPSSEGVFCVWQSPDLKILRCIHRDNYDKISLNDERLKFHTNPDAT